MSKTLIDVLDESLTYLETEQATIGECLSRHSRHTAELRPLLETALVVSQTPRPRASTQAFAVGKQRMLAALAEKRRQSADPGLLQRYARQITGLFVARRRVPALRWALVVAASITLFTVGVFLLRPQPGTRIAQLATLEQVNGPVEFQPAGSEAWLPAPTGTNVKAGDRVRTGPLAGATLIFFDGSTTALEANTEVTVVKLDTKQNGSSKTIALRQEVGQSRSRVQPLLDSDACFEIETPALVIAVRGTEFALGVESDGTTHVEVTEGIVDVAAEGITVSVPAGQTAEAEPGHAPIPILSETLTPAGPTSTPQPTEPPEKAESTETPEPTETSEPTATPKPTPTPEPTFTPTSQPPEPPPEPTSEPKPTQKPHPTHPPHPTKKPK